MIGGYRSNDFRSRGFKSCDLTLQLLFFFDVISVGRKTSTVQPLNRKISKFDNVNKEKNLKNN